MCLLRDTWVRIRSRIRRNVDAQSFDRENRCIFRLSVSRVQLWMHELEDRVAALDRFAKLCDSGY